MRRNSSPARDDGGLGWAMAVEWRTVGRSWILFRGRVSRALEVGVG